MTVPLHWNPTWTAFAFGPGCMRLSAGADRVVDVDGLTEDDIAAVAALVAEGVGSRPVGGLSAELRVHLVELGAVRFEPIARNPLPHVAVVGLTEATASMVGATQRVLQSAGRGTDGDAAIDVVIRCGPGQTTPHRDRPRLVVDIGHHHTVVIGPFVVPGSTACEGCLDMRVARRFEPATQPDEPGATRHSTLVAELVGRHVELAMAGRSPVLNATVAFDLDSMTARREALLMSPGCTLCGVPPPSPRPPLPWEEA